MTDEQVQEPVWRAALAGLLHDIGKFLWRARDKSVRAQGKQAQSKYGAWHAAAGDVFAADFVPQSLRQGLTGMGYHHHPESSDAQPDDALPWIVQLADWLSSGESEADEDARVPHLRSVFSRLQDYDQPAYLPLKQLALEEGTLFPHQESGNAWQPAHEREYADLYSAFEAACQEARLDRFGADTLTAYLETLYSLLMEFTWCVPSANDQGADVSLFDHLRTTAALSACLAADGRDAAWCKRVLAEAQAGRGDDDACVLVGGDLSGVQAFLYTLTSSGAAKSLRARSFYLQLLTEVVAQYALDQLGLPLTNLLYAGGGNFFILAGAGRKDDLEKLRRDVSLKLLTAHDGATHLALAAVPVRAREFARGKFHAAWDRLHQQLSIEKRRPLADLEPAQLAKEIGAAMGEGGDTDCVCDVCRRESPDKIPPDEDGLRKCNFCASLERLGAQLSHATHLVWLKSEASPLSRDKPGEWWRAMMAFGVNVFAVDADDPPGQAGYIDYWPEKLKLIQVNPLKKDARYEAALFKELQRGAPQIQAMRLFAQLVPMAGRQVMTFDELAGQSRGIGRWGVLRMDVDNLGDLFRRGFTRQDVNALTLARVASLSFALRLFFEGWLPRLGQPAWSHTDNDPAAKNGIRQDTLYVQYAGGDDVFVVGAWDALPEFAARIRESFRLYTSGNPAVTISGGVTLADEKFPLYLAADQAHAAESAAKNHLRANGQDKDAVCLFGQTVGWEQYPEVSRRAHLMADWCSGADGREPLPKSIIQSFLAIDFDFQLGAPEQGGARGKNKRQGVFYYGPWVWHAVYKLTRTIESLRNAPDVAQILGQWQEELVAENSQAIIIIGLAARWAELLTRKESEE